MDTGLLAGVHGVAIPGATACNVPVAFEMNRKVRRREGEIDGDACCHARHLVMAPSTWRSPLTLPSRFASPFIVVAALLPCVDCNGDAPTPAGWNPGTPFQTARAPGQRGLLDRRGIIANTEDLERVSAREGRAGRPRRAAGLTNDADARTSRIEAVVALEREAQARDEASGRIAVSERKCERPDDHEWARR